MIHHIDEVQNLNGPLAEAPLAKECQLTPIKIYFQLHILPLLYYYTLNKYIILN